MNVRMQQCRINLIEMQYQWIFRRDLFFVQPVFQYKNKANQVPFHIQTLFKNLMKGCLNLIPHLLSRVIILSSEVGSLILSNIIATHVIRVLQRYKVSIVHICRRIIQGYLFDYFILLPMGIARSTIQDFQNKYSSYSADCYVKKDTVQQGDQRSLFKVEQLILSNGSFTKLQRVVLNCEEFKQSYIKKIDDIYYEQKQEDTVKVLLVSQIDGVDLFTLLKNRQISGLKYKEEDACYMVQCLCRGITEGIEIGLEIPFINLFSVYLTKQYTFNLLMIPQDTGLKSLNKNQILMKQKNYNSLNIQIQTTRNLLKILNKQSNTDSLSINLFFVGILCLKMLNTKMQIARLYNNQQQQIDYHMISEVIKQINDKKLKWLLWLLLNQYPCERKEVFKQLNPLFLKVDYPKDILLRGTSLIFDIEYVQKKLFPQVKIQQKKINLNKWDSQNVQKQFKCDRLSKDKSYSFDYLKSQFNSAPFNLKFSTPNLSLSSSFEHSPRQKTQLPSIKLKSWLSEQTQVSSLKNNSQLCHSIKEIEASFKKENFTKFPLQDGQIKHANKLDTQLQSALRQQQDNLSHYLSSQEESIILINPNASDQQSEDAVRVDIEDFFGDLRTKKYYINQNPCTFNERNQIKNSSPKALFRKFSNSIIREESIEQSISGQQCEVDYVLEQYQSGERYEGYKKNGHRNGYGKFYYSGGGIYEGDWKDNQMDGYGKLFYEELIIAYQGYWKKDSFHGKGKLYNQSSSQNCVDLDYRDLSSIDNYWKVYEGQFNQDEKQGYGRLTFSNGQEFRGLFKKDLINGEGHFILKNGKVIQGFWNNSLLVRQY